jgi:hypothetical protein
VLCEILGFLATFKAKMIRSKMRGHDLLKEARSDKEGPLPTQGRPDLLMEFLEADLLGACNPLLAKKINIWGEML